MKICNICKEEKELSEFQKRSSNKDGHTGMCKLCKRSYDNNHYKNNQKRKEYLRESRLRYSRKNGKYIYDYLLEHPCVDCGETDPIVLHFDHRDGVNKLNNIGAMRNNGIKKIQEEIDKCDVRCANCHARRTAKQFDWYAGFLLE